MSLSLLEKAVKHKPFFAELPYTFHFVRTGLVLREFPVVLDLLFSQRL